MKNHSPFSGNKRGWETCAVGLLILGVATRLYAAWTLHQWDMRDTGVCLLMSRHMALGEAWPVFYYGQAHMGSLEPFIGSLFCRVVGIGAYPASLGTVLLGSLALWVVYAMVREHVSARAGCFALLPLVAGSDTLLYLSAHPRGGYMSMLLFGLLTLRFSVRYTQRTWQRTEGAGRDLLWAGFCAGVGWWNSQLMVVYLAASALVVLPALPRSIRPALWLAALAAFFAGSLPWWLWNMFHDWGTFGFAGSFRDVSLIEGLSMGLHRFPEAMGYEPWPSMLNAIRFTAALGLAVATVVIFRRREDHAQQKSSPCILVLSCVWTLVVLLLLYAASHFASLNTTRYLLPAIPALVILSAMGAEMIWRLRGGPWVAAMLLGLTISPNLIRLPDWSDRLSENRARWQQVEGLADVLQRVSEGVAQGTVHLGWVAFASRERAIVAEAPHDVYAPYNRRASEAADQAFIDNHRGIVPFMQSTDAGYRLSHPDGFDVLHSLTPPRDDWKPLPSDVISTVRWRDTGESLKALHDGDLGGEVVRNVGKGGAATVEWAFKRPVNLVGLELPRPGRHGLSSWNLEGRRPDGSWVPLTEEGGIYGWFWSGGRVYWMGPGYKAELRWTPPASGITGLRLHGKAGDFGRIRLNEVLFLEADPEASIAEDRDWADVIRDVGLDQVYAPRAVMESLYRRLGDSVEMQVPFHLRRTVHQLPRQEPSDPELLQVSERTGLLVDRRMVERTRDALQKEGVTWREKQGAHYSLLILESFSRPPSEDGYIPLLWTERGAFAGSADWNRFERAQTMVESAEECPDQEAVERLSAAFRLAPDHPEAAEKLHELLLENGHSKDAEEVLKTHRMHAVPDRQVEAEFRSGMTLVGVDVASDGVAESGRMTFTWYWRFAPQAPVRYRSVFVHFKQGDQVVLQDDHNLPEVIDVDAVKKQPYPRTFQVVRTVQLPPRLRNIPLDITCGLVNPHTEKRDPTGPFWFREKSVAVTTLP